MAVAYMPSSVSVTMTAKTSDTWYQWVNTSITTATASTITLHSNGTGSNLVWDNWRNVGYTTTGTYTWQDEIWHHWEMDEAERADMERQRDELQARREQQNRERLAADQKRQEDYLVAHARALELLDDLLTEEERATRDEQQRIGVRGSDGHLYWIEMHRETVHGNIVRTDEHGCMLGRACVAPAMYGDAGPLPTPDGWVGQYLGLKFDAHEFLSHANWSTVRRCQVREEAA